MIDNRYVKMYLVFLTDEYFFVNTRLTKHILINRILARFVIQSIDNDNLFLMCFCIFFIVEWWYMLLSFDRIMLHGSIENIVVTGLNLILLNV